MRQLSIWVLIPRATLWFRPFITLIGWTRSTAMGNMQAYRDGKTNVLSVSRVAPHKNQESLIEAFAIYHYHNRDSRLLLIGREEKAFETYSLRLRGVD